MNSRREKKVVYIANPELFKRKAIVEKYERDFNRIIESYGKGLIVTEQVDSYDLAKKIAFSEYLLMNLIERGMVDDTVVSDVKSVIMKGLNGFQNEIMNNIVTIKNYKSQPSLEYIDELKKKRSEIKNDITKLPVIFDFDKRPEVYEFNPQQGGFGNLLNYIRFDLIKQIKENGYSFIPASLMSDEKYYLHPEMGLYSFSKVFVQLFISKKDNIFIEDKVLKLNTPLIEAALNAMFNYNKEEIFTNPFSHIVFNIQNKNEFVNIYNDSVEGFESMMNDKDGDGEKKTGFLNKLKKRFSSK
jgi:hypothetical protein